MPGIKLDVDRLQICYFCYFLYTFLSRFHPNLGKLDFLVHPTGLHYEPSREYNKLHRLHKKRHSNLKTRNNSRLMMEPDQLKICILLWESYDNRVGVAIIEHYCSLNWQAQQTESHRGAIAPPSPPPPPPRGPRPHAYIKQCIKLARFLTSLQT